MQEIDMRRREGSGLTVARLHRLAARCELPKLLVFAEGTAEARRIDGVERDHCETQRHL